jgi:hypothetical protein
MDRVAAPISLIGFRSDILSTTSAYQALLVPEEAITFVVRPALPAGVLIGCFDNEKSFFDLKVYIRHFLVADLARSEFC